MLIKYCFLIRENAVQTKQWFDKSYGNLLHPGKFLKSGYVNLNVIGQWSKFCMWIWAWGSQPQNECTKANNNTTIDWNGCGFCFPGFQWYIVYWLFVERKNNQQWLLLCIIEPIERRNYKKTASFVEEKMYPFARQWTSLQIDKNDGKNQWITLRIASPPILFSRSVS